jgi:hypothetical protein
MTDKHARVITSLRLPVAAAALTLLAACTQTQPEPPRVEVTPVPEPRPCPVVEAPVCPEPKVIEKVVIKEVPAPLPPMATVAGKMHLPIVGGVEWVTLEPPGFRMEARMDTGVETSAVHAEDARLIEKDGERFVRFKLINPDGGEPAVLELPLERKVLIKQSSGEPEPRYVVKLGVLVGEARAQIEVSLTDRSNFEHRLLIGRNFLTDTAIVDVGRQHLQTPLQSSP